MVYTDEIIAVYGKKGFWAKLRYNLLYIWRMFLYYLTFLCPATEMRVALNRLRGVKIGKNVYLGYGVMIDKLFPEMVTIKDNAAIGDDTIINSHAIVPSPSRVRKIYPLRVAPVTIGEGVWILPRVTITLGVNVGDEAILLSGAVVTKDVPPRCMVGGVPAKVIKDLSNHEVFKKNKK